MGDNGQWRMRMFPIWMRKVLWHYLWGMVRGERFCDGAIMGMIKSGAAKKWLLRLQELKEMQ